MPEVSSTTNIIRKDENTAIEFKHIRTISKGVHAAVFSDKKIIIASRLGKINVNHLTLSKNKVNPLWNIRVFFLYNSHCSTCWPAKKITFGRR